MKRERFRTMREQTSEAATDIVYGKNPALELIKDTNTQVNKIWLSENMQDRDLKEKIVLYAKEKKIPYVFVPNQKLDKLTNHQKHQGIVLSISPINYLTIDEVIKNKKIVLVAHEIEDTHNLGALIRTFVAGSGKGIILTGRSSVGINATVTKTSAGALFQAELARATNCVNVLNKLKENDFWTVGTDNSKEAKSIYETKFPEKIAILIGNEHEGLPRLVKENCDFLVKIPISTKTDSLNVSVAFGIVLFEIIRQKQSLNIG